MNTHVQRLTREQAESRGKRIQAQIIRAVFIRDAAERAFEKLKGSEHWPQVADTMGWSREADFGDMTC